MRTPANKECSYFYEDFNRGANVRQCRAVRASGSEPWSENQCALCPVPDIQAANGNPYLELTLVVGSGKWGWKRRFKVAPRCLLHGPVGDPYVGCVQCNAEIGLDLSDLE